MVTIYNGRPLDIGERIPGTALTFIQPILPRRGEFMCDCGRSVPYNLSEVEKGKRKSCGCGHHKKNKVK
jgi:hypothetical protein